MLTSSREPPTARGLFVMVVHAGPLATRNREPGQARKGAAVVVAACAGVRLAGTASPIIQTTVYIG